MGCAPKQGCRRDPMHGKRYLECLERTCSQVIHIMGISVNSGRYGAAEGHWTALKQAEGMRHAAVNKLETGWEHQMRIQT